MKVIEQNVDALERGRALGFKDQRASEPPPEWVRERFRYRPARGQLVGPRGDVLKLRPAWRGGGPRIGYWSEGTSKTLDAARVAFVVQHGRWPCWLECVSGDAEDLRAVNWREAVSPRVVAAESRRKRPQGRKVASPVGEDTGRRRRGPRGGSPAALRSEPVAVFDAGDGEDDLRARTDF